MQETSGTLRTESVLPSHVVGGVETDNRCLSKIPILVGGLGEINFGKQYRQGNRVYSGKSVAMALTAQPLGNAGGYSYLYLVEINDTYKASD